MDSVMDFYLDLWSKLKFTFSIEGRNQCTECNRTISSRDVCGPYQMTFCSDRCYLQLVRRQHRKRTEKNDVPGCLKPGCKSPCYVKNTGECYEYCGKVHAQEHAEEIRRMFSPVSIQQPVVYSQRVQQDSIIFFYNKDEPYYEFTNFAKFPIVVDSAFYHTSEHYFQSQKLVGTPYEHQIALLQKPSDAFEFPHQPHVAPWVRKDWQQVKVCIMYKALYHKFKQYPMLKRMLMQTKGKQLVENSPFDSFWGNGKDKNGENMLGKLLMLLRDHFDGIFGVTNAVLGDFSHTLCMQQKQENQDLGTHV